MLARSTHLNVWNGINDATLFDSFDKCITSTVVRDGKAKCIFRFDNFNLFRSSLAMRKNEIIQTDLSAQQFRHINFMWIQCAENDLEIIEKQKKIAKISNNSQFSERWTFLAEHIICLICRVCLCSRKSLTRFRWNQLPFVRYKRSSATILCVTDVKLSAFHSNGNYEYACKWNKSVAPPDIIIPIFIHFQCRRVQINPCGFFFAAAFLLLCVCLFGKGLFSPSEIDRKCLSIFCVLVIPLLDAFNRRTVAVTGRDKKKATWLSSSVAVCNS